MTIDEYNQTHEPAVLEMMQLLRSVIDAGLPGAESKLWHGSPVWFLEGNPIVGYDLQKKGLRLMFWSGKSFDEPRLDVVGGKFQDASIFYDSVQDIDADELAGWLKKSQLIQWDYKNIVKRKGELVRI